jgi:hypothetical protein
MIAHRMTRKSTTCHRDAGEGWDISLVGTDPSPPGLWNRNNYDREANELWIGFGFDPERSPYHIRGLLKGKVFPGIHDLIFERQFGDCLPVRVALCVANLTDGDVLAKGAYAGVNPLSHVLESRAGIAVLPSPR